MNVIREIRAALAWRGMTIAELAKETGIPVSRLSRRMNGGGDFTTTELDQIGSIVGIRASELMRRAEDSGRVVA